MLILINVYVMFRFSWVTIAFLCEGKKERKEISFNSYFYSFECCITTYFLEYQTAASIMVRGDHHQQVSDLPRHVSTYGWSESLYEREHWWVILGSHRLAGLLTLTSTQARKKLQKKRRTDLSPFTSLFRLRDAPLRVSSVQLDGTSDNE